MPRVLILGATGYIGLRIARTLLATGNYTVWGSARSATKAKYLLQNEIYPIESDITDPSTLASTIATLNIDIVVDATTAYDAAAAILQGVVTAAQTRRTALLADNIHHFPKLGFVYSSGAWVYGSPNTRVNDLSPVGSRLSQAQPAPIYAWRPRHEQAILDARELLDVAILRPCAVYGGSSWVYGVWWRDLLSLSPSTPDGKMGQDHATGEVKEQGKISVPARPGARAGTAHVDDIATAFVAAIERLDGSLGTWPVFDLVTETLSVKEIVEAARTALGSEAPVILTGPGDDGFLEGMSLVATYDAARAKTVLGWRPKRVDFLGNIEVFVRAWMASQPSPSCSTS
jgi:nucleoside-diphosphate-sugar epimerase